MDFASRMRRESRTFRSAFRELQRTGWYHGKDGSELVYQMSRGNFLIHDPPCLSFGHPCKSCNCCFVIEVSNGRGKATMTIGIVFDYEENAFHLNEDCLRNGCEIPLFDSVCKLVNYYQTNSIAIDWDIAETLWNMDYESESDVFEGIVIAGGEDPDSEEIGMMLDDLVQQSKESYSSVDLYEPILKKDE